MRNFATFFVVVLALVAAGCTPAMSTSDTLKPGDEYGVAIVGLTVAEGGADHTIWGLMCAQGLHVNWRRTAGVTPRGEKDTFSSRAGCLDSPTPDKLMYYNVLKLTPGSYALVNVERSLGRDTNITQFRGKDAPKFSLKAGEVVYLGNITFAAKDPYDIIGYGRDDEKARAVLKGYPGISVPMVDRNFTF